MPIPYIQLHEPKTIAEACSLLSRYPRVSRVLAGGTDLLVDLKRERVTGVEHLISLANVGGLRSIEETENEVRIGTLVTPNQVARDSIIRKRYPALLDAVSVMASYPIRNMATIGGNIASAVPCSDFAPLFIAGGGRAVLSSGDSERVVKVEDYIIGPRETVCGDAEILTHLLLPKPVGREGMAYKKFMLRKANGVAVAGVAAKLKLKDTISQSCIVLTAVAPTPVIACEAGDFLTGKIPSDELLERAAALARKAAHPITDIRGTLEYRLELVEVLARRALEDALARARKEG